MSRAASLAVIIACACGRTIELPELGDAKSVVLLVEGGEVDRVEVHDLAARNRRISVDGAEQLTLLLYAENASVLGLPEGSLAPHLGEDGRHLPPPERALERSLGAAGWLESNPESSGLFNTFRFEPETAAQCVARGGCYPRIEDRACVQPCPAPAGPMLPLVPPSPLPVLLPCPPGWSERAAALITVCEPRPGATEEPSCAAGTHPFLGGDCRAIGEACAPDGWPVVEGGPTVIWIQSGANGVGSRADPFGSIGAAIAGAPPLAVLAIASGRYLESVQLDEGRELLGACAGGTIIEGSIDASDGSLRALTVEGEVRASGRLRIEEVEIIGGDAALQVASGAELDATRTVVSASARALHTEPGANTIVTDSIFAAPIAADFSAGSATVTGTLLFGETQVHVGRVRLERSELMRDGGAALTSSASAVVLGEDVVIRGAGAGPAIVSSASTMVLTRARIEAESTGLTAERVSYVTLEHVALSEVGAEGIGVSSTSGGLVARNVLVEDFTNAAFVVENTNLLVTGSTMRRCARGVTAREGAEIHVDTSIIEETEDWAIRIDGVVNRPGETYQLEDLELRRINGGVRIIRTQTGRLSRIATRDSRGPSVSVGTLETSPTALVEDLSIAGVSFACAGEVGNEDCAAIAVTRGSLDLDRFEVSDADGIAVRIAAGAGAQLANGRVIRAPIGIAAFGEGRDPRELLRAVQFEEVDAPCDPCGE